MEDDIVVSVNELRPGDMWPLPVDKIDELAEYLINSMIRHQQEKKTYDKSLFPPSSPEGPEGQLLYAGNGVRHRGIRRPDVADVD